MTTNHRIQTGTALTWKASGGDYALTLTSLAAGASRQGVKGDLGAKRATIYAVALRTKWTTAPTAGANVTVRISQSPSATAATNNTGSASGADEAYTETNGLLDQMTYVGPLTSKAQNSAIQEQIVGYLANPLRYVMPVVTNGDSTQALSATAADHEVVLYPVEDVSDEAV